MQIGGSIGSIVGRYLRVTDRERRTLRHAGNSCPPKNSTTGRNRHAAGAPASTPPLPC
jgi:hypothetical protein